jgi:hypothetical protein
VTRRAAALVVVGVGALALISGPPASADSFTPIGLAIGVAPVARLHAPLAITIGVTADPGVLDASEGPLRVEVRLAPECGGTFQSTTGTTLLNHALTPPPRTGKAYVSAVSGSGRPSAYGAQTVCVYLEDTDIGRVYANDESTQVTVSMPCTAAASAYDRARAALNRARKQLRHSKRPAVRRRLARTIAARKRTAARDRRRAAAACGQGVPL